MGCPNLRYPETASPSSPAQETFPCSPAPVTVASAVVWQEDRDRALSPAGPGLLPWRNSNESGDRLQQRLGCAVASLPPQCTYLINGGVFAGAEVSPAAVAVCRQVTAWGRLGGATGPSPGVRGPGSCHLLSCCSHPGLSLLGKGHGAVR